MNLDGSLAPAVTSNASGGKKCGCAGLGEVQSLRSAAMQEVGVGDIGDERHAGLNADRFLIATSELSRSMQGGRGDLVDRREAASRLRPGAAGTVAPRGHGAVAAQGYGTRKDIFAPALRHQIAERL